VKLRDDLPPYPEDMAPPVDDLPPVTDFNPTPPAAPKPPPRPSLVQRFSNAAMRDVNPTQAAYIGIRRMVNPEYRSGNYFANTPGAPYYSPPAQTGLEGVADAAGKIYNQVTDPVGLAAGIMTMGASRPIQTGVGALYEMGNTAMGNAVKGEQTTGMELAKSAAYGVLGHRVSDAVFPGRANPSLTSIASRPTTAETAETVASSGPQGENPPPQNSIRAQALTSYGF
jgi:hypothetical protein